MSDDDEENEKDLAKNMKELLASLTPVSYTHLTLPTNREV